MRSRNMSHQTNYWNILFDWMEVCGFSCVVEEHWMKKQFILKYYLNILFNLRKICNFDYIFDEHAIEEYVTTDYCNILFDCMDICGFVCVIKEYWMNEQCTPKYYLKILFNWKKICNIDGTVNEHVVEEHVIPKNYWNISIDWKRHLWISLCYRETLDEEIIRINQLFKYFFEVGAKLRSWLYDWCWYLKLCDKRRSSKLVDFFFQLMSMTCTTHSVCLCMVNCCHRHHKNNQRNHCIDLIHSHLLLFEAWGYTGKCIPTSIWLMDSYSCASTLYIRWQPSKEKIFSFHR